MSVIMKYPLTSHVFLIPSSVILSEAKNLIIWLGAGEM